MWNPRLCDLQVQRTGCTMLFQKGFKPLRIWVSVGIPELILHGYQGKTVACHTHALAVGIFPGRGGCGVCHLERRKSKEMHGKQLLSLEQNSFILWNPKGAESMWLTGLSTWTLLTHTKKMQNPHEFRALEPLAGC